MKTGVRDQGSGVSERERGLQDSRFPAQSEIANRKSQINPQSASSSPAVAGNSQSTVSRISPSDALSMYFDASIHDLGRQAHGVMRRLHPEPYRTYVVDRNINYANWCSAKCIFCNFKADPPGMNSSRPELPPGYVLTHEQIAQKIRELIDIGGTQILMQGGLVPAELLPFEWYLDLLRFIKRDFPTIHTHAFSPPEIFAMHQIFGMSIREVLLRLRDAGLDTIPGGGAEILSDRVRDKISRGKTRTGEYLEVMRQAHQIGMKTSITMMFGHIETIEERIEHLRLIRDLQDETGGFTAFICWTFQPDNTPLGRLKQLPIADRELRIANCSDLESNSQSEIRNSKSPRPLPDGKHLLLADGHEYLKMLAISRVFLDNVPNIQSSWVTQGPKIGQLALFFGANDMGSVMMEENVVSAAGTTYRLSENEIRRLISDAGWTPQKRNCYYQPIG
jgi:cyclic dehypoxanthinyl futalosine synthase